MSRDLALLVGLIAFIAPTACHQEGPPIPAQQLASAEAQQRGRELFLEHCALCHGENANGRGVRRHGLVERPVDFTDPDWRRQTDARSVFSAIRDGKRGTSMPAWPQLSDQQIWDLTAYVLSVAPQDS